MAKSTAPQGQDLHGNSAVSFGSANRWLDYLSFHMGMAVARLVFRHGNLTIRFRNEAPVSLGDGTGPASVVDINSTRFLRRLLPSPDLAVGEAYMDGEWRLATGDLAQAIGTLLVNDEDLRKRWIMRALSTVAQILANPHKVNDPRHSRSNVAHHYDIGNDLYQTFLDEGMNYSCAFFETPDQSLRDAQLNKLRTSIRRLGIEPGMFVLDIGCGWGELTRLITSETEAQRVVGITLAEEQCRLARGRIAPDHANRLSYLLEDYRHHARNNAGAYDRIVSIGMFEHVGKRHFVDYFETIAKLLKPGGGALVHSIVRLHPSFTSPWVDKYIFPGGYIPTLDDMTGSAQAAGLKLSVDPYIHESFHYANTLRHWRRQFNEGFASLDHSHYDDKFRRMWNFYLAGSESAFDVTGFRVAQIRVEKAA